MLWAPGASRILMMNKLSRNSTPGGQKRQQSRSSVTSRSGALYSKVFDLDNDTMKLESTMENMNSLGTTNSQVRFK